jgi:hypothetical protein
VNTSPLLSADVEHFVAAVRRHFTDLDPEEREELLGGLEADISDLVAERGTGALGDPGAYATELRAAAGLPPSTPRRARTFPGIGLGEVLDDVHRFWDRALDALPGSPRGFVESLQPVWWVLRAVVAWLLVQDFRFPSVVLDARWWLVLAVMVAVSVQLGRGGLGLGVLRRAAAGRVLVVALNLLALALLPGAVDRVAWYVAETRGEELYGHSWNQGVDPEVITYQGRQVCTLRVVDTRGRRVEGLRVLDATSRELLPMNNPRC